MLSYQTYPENGSTAEAASKPFEPYYRTAERYQPHILIQVAAVESALQSFGYIVLQTHMETCVVEEVINGNEKIMEETIELVKKLK